MVASALFIAIASSLFAFAQADAPYPIAPVNSVYKSGSTCHIQWLKGSSGWQGMTIELMTGPNPNMISLATVATGQDGTKDGSFDHPCPEVNLNAPIYFYRFTSKGETPNYTTRFTIASSSGHTDSAPNPTQPPPDNSAIPWGVGKITSGSSTNSSTSTSSGTSKSTSSGTSKSTSSGTSTSTTSSTSTSTTSSTSTGVNSGSITSSGRSSTIAITPTSSPSGTRTTVVPTTRTLTYVTTKTFDHHGEDRTKVLTNTFTVTDKVTSIIAPTPTAGVTVTTTIWIKPTPTTVISTALKFTTSYIQVTATPPVSSVTTTQTVSSVSTVTVNSAGVTVSGGANRSTQKSSARSDFPTMYILAFVVGSAATCLTLLS